MFDNELQEKEITYARNSNLRHPVNNIPENVHTCLAQTIDKTSKSKEIISNVCYDDSID